VTHTELQSIFNNLITSVVDFRAKTTVKKYVGVLDVFTTGKIKEI
jgi:hypothetical protein